MRYFVLTVIAFKLASAPVKAEDEERFAVLTHEIVKAAAPRAKVTALQAIDLARKSAGTSPFVLVELAMDGNTPMYEVGFITEKGASEAEYDAITGKPIPLDPETIPPSKVDEDLRKRAALTRAKGSLGKAIETALSRVKNATTVLAKAEVANDLPVFTVELLVGDVFKIVTLDSDGAVIKIVDSQNEPGGRAWTFDNDAAGNPPAGWTSGYTNTEEGRAKWTVEKHEKPMTGPNALRLEAHSGGRAFNLAMIDGTSYEDVDVRARLCPNTGKEDQGGGLIWRCKDADNYYVCRINPLEDNFRVYHVIKGKREMIKSVDVPTEAGKWYAVRAKMMGDHIMCFLDGKKLLDARDTSIKGPGMIGLWTKADASSSFDNVAVRNPVSYKTDNDPAVNPGVAKPSKREDHDDDDDDE
jgi:hypothetical protein